MKNALVLLGVPDSCITLDYAGLRTLDSVVRGKEIFGQDKFIIVTQKFHSYRAVFISRYHGIDATALAASNIPFRKALKILGREFLARPIAIIDLYITKKEPRHMGEKEELRY
jgi:SanA protein